MLIRRISVILGIAIFAGAFLWGKHLSKKKELKRNHVTEITERKVMTIEVKNGTIPAVIPVIGRLESSQKVQIYSEVNGIFTSSIKSFDEGVFFKKGEVMIKLDDREAMSKLYALKSDYLNALTSVLPDIKIDFPNEYEEWEDYMRGFKLEGSINAFPEPKNDTIRFFLMARNVYGQYFLIKSAEIDIERYTIRAPFDGVVSKSFIDNGRLVTIAQKLGEFSGRDEFFLEASVNVSSLSSINIGDKVVLTSSDRDGEWYGEITRISDYVDPNTQTLKLFIDVRSSELKDGMYLNGSVKGIPQKNVFEFPRRYLLPGNYVFVVKNGELNKVKLELIRLGEETAIVRGLKNGEKVLNELISGAYSGMKVSE